MFTSELLRTFEEMEELLDGLNGPFVPSGRPRTPFPLNLYEDGEGYVLEMPLPGVDPRSLTVDLEGRVLTVSGERPQPDYAREEGRRWRERRYGRFKQSVRLPREVDREGIKALYRHGVLVVTLPKPQVERRRKVPVKVS